MSTLPPLAAAASSQSGWRGDLELKFTWDSPDTKMRLVKSAAPLRTQRPFYPEGPQVCHVAVLHTAGGVVGGDQLHLSFQVEAAARVLVTSASPAKVYRSDGAWSSQCSFMRVAPGGWLEWLPQETILFRGARWSQNLRVELEPGATWLGWDLTRLGRSARGERFTAGAWHSRTEVWQAGRPLWIDPQRLQGSEELPEDPHSLRGSAVLATLAFLGQEVTADLLTEIRSLPVLGGEYGVTRLQSGLLCRYRGPSTAAAQGWFRLVWHQLRCRFLQRPACVPRVWPRL